MKRLNIDLREKVLKTNIRIYQIKSETMSDTAKSRVYQFGEFRLEAETRRLFDIETEKSVQLQPKAFELLLMLIEANGEILTRHEIIEKIWAESFVEEANLTQTVFVLRKALKDDRQNPRFIITVPNRGYRFIAKIEKKSESELTTAGGDLTLDTENKTEISNIETERPKTIDRKRISVRLVLFAIPLIILFAAGVYYFWREKKPETIGEIKSIAVLPFKNIGGKVDEEYLGNGLSEVLVSRLSNIKTIVVRPATSVLKFTDPSPDTKKIGSDLNVEAIVMGRVQRVDEKIRVTVQLVRVSDGVIVWSETFDNKFTNIFAVQDSISQRVAESLELKLTSDERKQITKISTSNAEAFQFYLRGKFFWNKRTGADLLKAVENFKLAIEKDPSYALAYTGLAECYILLPEYGAELPENALPKAKQAIRTALEIDGESADIHAALGYTQAFYDWDWAEAEKSFKRAIELNPNNATAHQWYAEYLADLGKFDEAHAEFAKAMQIDPTSPIIINDDAHIYFNRRKYDESIAQLRKCLDLEPNFGYCNSNLAFAFEQKGMFAEALEFHTKAMILFGEPPDAVEEVRRAFARNGIKGFWEMRLEQFKSREHLKKYPAYSTAWCYARIGDKAGALEWLEKSFQRRERYLPTAKTTPIFDLLREEPRFQDLLKRMGL